MDLENIEIQIKDKDQALLLLRSLPSSYEVLCDKLVYSRDSLTLEEVQTALMSKDLKKRTEYKEREKGEGLAVRGRFDRRENKPRGRSRSKSKGKLKCFKCHKEGHFRRDCPELKKSKKNGKDLDQGDVSVASNNYESADVLVVVDKKHEKEWILDLGCSFHMSPMKH